MVRAVYAVAVGRIPGLYYDWDSANAQVNGFSGAQHQRFATAAEALEYLNAHSSQNASTIRRDEDQDAHRPVRGDAPQPPAAQQPGPRAGISPFGPALIIPGPGMVVQINVAQVEGQVNPHAAPARHPVILTGSKYYAVQKGRQTGVFGSWEECHAQVNGFSAPVFKSFRTHAEALAFVQSVH